MANPENIVGKGFEKHPERINKKGRPRKLVGTVSKELESKGIKPASNQQIRDIFMQFVNMPESELKEVIADKEQPMLNRIVVKAMLDNKGFEVIKDLVERAHGKAKEHHEVTGLEPLKIRIIEGDKDK